MITYVNRLLFLLIALSSLAIHTYGQFDQWRTLNGGVFSCQSVGGADFDGDGDIDILVSSQEAKKIGWIENLGEGNFSTQHFIYHKDFWNVYGVAAADFDEDGDPDVAAVTYNGELCWFENRGGGIFADKVIISEEVNQGTEIRVDDFDGDLDLDIVVVETDTDVISWFENDGDANFNSREVLHSFTLNTFRSLEVVDMDVDGDLDFLVCVGWGSHGPRLYWMENDGDANFTQQMIEHYPWAVPYGVYFIAMDYDEDGDMDAVGINSAPPSQLVWYENLGEGSWADVEILSTDLDAAIYIQAFDIDNDTDLDIILFDQDDNDIYWFENLGGGSFGPKVICPGYFSRVQSMFIADIDGDSDKDVVAADEWGDHVSLFLNTGDSIGASQRLDYRQYESHRATAGDLDNDGDMEIICVDDDAGYIFVSENLGNRTFKYQDTIPSSFVSGCWALETFDPDNDGDLDVLSSSYHTDKLAWYENDGLGNLAEPQFISESIDAIRDAYPADVDGDGLTDVLIGTLYTNRLSWYKNLGGGLWTPEIYISDEMDGVISVFAADVDGDDDMDVVAASYFDDRIAWFENLGGPFGPQQVISLASSGPREVYCADLDGDHDMDVVAVSNGDDKVVWFENLGDGTFSEENVVALGVFNVNSVKCTDVDNDGDLDIVTARNKIQWYENDGSGNFSEPSVISDEPGEPYAVIAADIDGDGDQDLVTSSNESYEWYENLLNNPYQFRGELYFDENLNGVRDSGEIGMELSEVVTSPEGLFTYSYPNGKFLINVDPEVLGTYEVFPEDYEYWSIVTDSLMYHVAVDEDFLMQDSLDFGFAPDTLANELEVNLVGAFPRCNDTVNYYLDIKNVGTTFPSGKIHLALHDSLTYYNCTVEPDSVSGQNYYWSYDSLYYFQDTLLRVGVIMPDVLSIGIPLESYLTATIDSLPDTVFVLTDVLSQSLLCGYDPNDKIADPKGIDSLGYIPLDTEEIEYLVRFQNTGTDTAFNVEIVDWLDSHLDWASIEILSTSHDMTFDITPAGKVSFNFDNIALPDSNVNYAGSQGYVKYRININEGLPLGTQIKNFASIYFDLNPAVITNTTINTLWDCQSAVEEVLLSSPTCHEDTLLGFIPNLPESATVNWDITDIFTSDLDTLVWPADSIGVHDLVISIDSYFCSFDSTLSIEVLGPELVDLDPIGICTGDSTLVFGHYQSAAGVYTDTVMSVFGCDSINTVELVLIEDVVTTVDDLNFCTGDSLLVFGVYISTEGTYYDTLSSVITGCDSVLTQHVYEWGATTTATGETTICVGDSALVFGTYVNVEGVYYDTLSSVFGCDSILTHSVATSIPEASINGLYNDTLICIEDKDIAVDGVPFGGTASGTGVSGDYFNAFNAGLGTHYVYYTFTNSYGCTDIDSVKVIVIDCLGLNENELNEITIYPNPATGVTTVNFGQDLEGAWQVQIVDVVGKVIYTSTFINGSQWTIDVSNFASGTYFLTLRNQRNETHQTVSKLYVE